MGCFCVKSINKIIIKRTVRITFIVLALFLSYSLFQNCRLLSYAEEISNSEKKYGQLVMKEAKTDEDADILAHSSNVLDASTVNIRSYRSENSLINLNIYLEMPREYEDAISIEISGTKYIPVYNNGQYIITVNNIAISSFKEKDINIIIFGDSLYLDKSKISYYFNLQESII